MRDAFTAILVTSFSGVMQRLAGVAPRLMAMATLILVGWAAATVARRLIGRVLRAIDFDGRCTRWGLTPALASRSVRQPPSEIAGHIVYWMLFLLALVMAVEALEVPATSGLVALVFQLLPNIIVAALILVVGWLLANFLAQATLITVVNAQVAGAPVIAAAVRWLVLLFAGAMALTQVGIGREMVLVVFGIMFGGTVLALALAFGLGGRDLARKVLEGLLQSEEARESDRVSHL